MRDADLSLESQNLFCIHSLNLPPCQIWVAMFLDFLNFLMYRLITKLKNRIKVTKSAQNNHYTDIISHDIFSGY